MRGALPDAECARCGARFPPSFESPLVTCAKCGLVFTPHDVQRRYRPTALVASSRPSPALTFEPTIANLGDGVQLIATPERLQIGKRVDRAAGMAALAAGAVAAQFVAPWLLLLGFAAAAPLWFTRLTMVLEGDEVRVSQRPIPLAGDRRFRLAEITALVVVTIHPPPKALFDILVQLQTGNPVRLVRSVSRPTADAAVGWLTQRLAIRPAVG